MGENQAAKTGETNLVTTKVGGGRTNVIGPGTNFFGKGTLEGGPNIKKFR